MHKQISSQNRGCYFNRTLLLVSENSYYSIRKLRYSKFSDCATVFQIKWHLILRNSVDYTTILMFIDEKCYEPYQSWDDYISITIPLQSAKWELLKKA